MIRDHNFYRQAALMTNN